MARLAVHCDFTELVMLKARLKDRQADIDSASFDIDGGQPPLQLPENRVPKVQARSSISVVDTKWPNDWIESTARHPTFNGNIHVRHKVSLPGEPVPRTIDPLCENS